MKLTLSLSLAAWIPQLHFSAALREDALHVNDSATELRFRVTERAGSYSLHASMRGREWKPIMRTNDMYYLEVEVIRVLFPSFRVEKNLSELEIPFRWDEAAIGFTPIELEDGWTTLWRNGAPLPFEIQDVSRVRPVIEYSYLVGSSIPELIAAIESPDGGIVGSRVAARLGAAQNGPSE